MNAILDAITTVTGWALVLFATVVIGFCGGYWIGHQEVMGATATLGAFAWVPVVWLGQPLIFIPYAVTALAFYLPIRLERGSLYLGAAITTLAAWVIVVAVIVDATSHGKFWRW